ncbi:solute carrier family 22 member 6 isoform X4 [Pungitius pungitius]|uniref:solute carrier family 22 member 6 isoform X4 n=1 Tax=Pungitius pungitius TaxID=134920 RepID=UPI001888C652|nr:solute carrier family 22 member 6 isoform X4 [Pungitius pungitius]
MLLLLGSSHPEVLQNSWSFTVGLLLGTSSVDKKMGFADLLEEVGGFGRYQWLHVTLISLPGLLMASQNLLNNFVSGIPAHHCSLPANHSHYNLSQYQVEEKEFIKAFIPMDSSGTRLDRCKRYVEPQWQLLVPNNTANLSQLQTEECLDGWTFDKTEFLATTVSEWQLVCSLRPLKQMIQTIYMAGVLTGAIIFGGLSDRFGRRSILIWSYLQLGILGCSSALSPSYTAYCIFRFLSGMAVSGIILNGVSLKVEWIPTKERTLVGTLSSFFFTFGQMVLAGLAYWLRDWRKLQLVACAPMFLFFSYSWWYVESARWLVLNRRSEEALKSLHRVARINGKPEVVDKLTLEVLHSHMSKEIESSRSTFTAYDLLRTRGMRRISICLVAVWFSTSFAYYGLAMDLQKFGKCRPSGPRWLAWGKVLLRLPSPPSICTLESSTPPSSDRNGLRLHHGEAWQHGSSCRPHAGRGIPCSAQYGVWGVGSVGRLLRLLLARDAEHAVA